MSGAIRLFRLLSLISGLVLTLALAGPALAQSCRVPERLPPARAEPVSPGTVRQVPITDYLLAISWSPQYCRSRGGAADPLQCGSGTRFGFVLHGLWPEGPGRTWPQYCRPAGPVPAAVVRASFCATPSVRLQQHEWQKHGSCMASSPERYFKASTGLFNALRWPDMERLSRVRPDAAGLSAAIAEANPGLTPAGIRILLGRGGWLEEVRICLDRDFRPARCPRDTPGARPRERVRIWRLER
jgi:ribonuclease T2